MYSAQLRPFGISVTGVVSWGIFNTSYVKHKSEIAWTLKLQHQARRSWEVPEIRLLMCSSFSLLLHMYLIRSLITWSHVYSWIIKQAQGSPNQAVGQLQTSVLLTSQFLVWVRPWNFRTAFLFIKCAFAKSILFFTEFCLAVPLIQCELKLLAVLGRAIRSHMWIRQSLLQAERGFS